MGGPFSGSVIAASMMVGSHAARGRIALRGGLGATRGGPLERRHVVAIRFGFVSTYPPTPCGLATFTAALFGALTSSGVDEGRVARLLDAPLPRAGSEVVWDLVAGDVAGPTGAAARLSSCDVVIVQHEFGVYGGRDGEDVLAVLAAVAAPMILTV